MTAGPDYEHEAKFSQSGAVIGVDEAGRGPWAGPVTASAFWINPAQIANLPALLTDSKKLSKAKHQTIRAELTAAEYGHHFAIQHVSSVTIDEIGILQATFLAMQQAVVSLAGQLGNSGIQIAHILVDGNLCPVFDWPASPIIKGDSKSLSIAAASIMAKTERDGLMQSLGREYPHYSWHKNAGYGTAEHQDAMRQFGITPYHRKSFLPVKRMIQSA